MSENSPVGPTHRFSDRVDDYEKYRPSYPDALLGLLQRACRLTADSVVADVGSGTGILSEIFLENGNTVHAVEPNDAMRRRAEARLRRFSRFSSIAATAESTTLAAGSVDIIAAAQAFHWFDREKARVEFARVLRPAGWVVLIWNDRRTTTTPFLVDYEALLQTHGTDYRQVDHKRMTRECIESFFGGGELCLATLYQEQHLDHAGLEGRLLSSSYTPARGAPGHDAMLAEARRIFKLHQRDSRVTLEYDTLVYYGRFGS